MRLWYYITKSKLTKIWNFKLLAYLRPLIQTWALIKINLMSGCILNDFPESTSKKPYLFSLEGFIAELKSELSSKWRHRFDFENLVEDDKQKNCWMIRVKNIEIDETDTIWERVSYPEWCTVRALEEFEQLFKQNKKYTYIKVHM